eukprot:CAMPEP_0116137252 /NCGR_PEP_ID=MMETSP0329-20121206/12154_1 /TAXON_ID=697910 /ORGANISM="Pseudo-nitzschia arenysensis, Strain B593" /LENGTH=494 /DNA_ID=CAMNT_0003632165 /DNA_START=146 /DNA_END=1630 /DNA_ORIENTATION=-
MTDSDYKRELEIAKADAMETAATLENLMEGIRAVKRILERPIGTEEEDKARNLAEASDITAVSKLSNELVGVLGSELIGLLNASQMVKAHARLRIEDDKKAIEELHTAKEEAHKVSERADKVDSMNLRLKAEKKLLVKEVKTLREDRQLLVKEVKSTRKIVERTKEFDAWRLLEDHLRDATMIHESVLSNKTFNTGFGGIDPPGTEVTTDADMEERIDDDYEIDLARDSPTTNKENNGKLAYSPRLEDCEENKSDRVLKFPSKPAAKASKAKKSPKPTTTSPPKKLTPAKKSGLKSIGSSFTTGLDRFKNALQEASDEMLGHPSPTNQKENASNDASTTSTKTEKNYKLLLDDDATRSTKSCSFDVAETAANGGEIPSGLNLSTSMISCGDGDISNDLALQISIDEGSSFFKTGIAKPLGEAHSPPTPLFMITPESVSSSSLGRSSKGYSKPLCDPNVLRTLSIPNGNAQQGEKSESATTLKPRIRSLRVRSRS